MDLSTLLAGPPKPVTKEITLSQEQQAILSAFINTWSNLAVQAAAGSGKTFMISQMVQTAKKHFPEKSISYFVFNTSARESAQQKMSGINIQTFHSLGLKLVQKYVRYSRRLPTFKSYNPIASIQETAIVNYIHQQFQEGIIIPDIEKETQYWPHVYELAEIVSIARTYNVKNVSELWTVASKHNLSTEGSILDTAMRIVLSRARQVTRVPKFNIDFTDMLYFAAQLDSTEIDESDKYDIIFVDESQDASKVRRLLVDKVLKVGGRVIMVGDINQSIYGFAGSDSSNFRSVLNNTNFKVFPLSTCYRCSKAVIAEAKELDPTIQAYEGSSEGLVTDTESLDGIQKGDVILCRNNAPLLYYYFKLAKKGIPAFIQGKDVVAEMLSILDRSKAKNNKDFKTYLDQQLQKGKNKKRKADGADFEDIVDCLLMCFPLVEAKMNKRHAKFRDNWASVLIPMFRPKTGAVELTTIHKSKGGEWPNVYLVRTDLLPSPYANAPWEKEEEMNLMYVAITRAINNLYYVKPSVK